MYMVPIINSLIGRTIILKLVLSFKKMCVLPSSVVLEGNDGDISPPKLFFLDVC